MGTVTVGSARIDESGRASGGRAGNQSGRELGRQDWYRHAKGWRVFRAVDPAQAEKIALAMERAIANPHIGYDQGQRLTLYGAAARVGFDPGLVEADVECDCSSLVRVCLAYAGIRTASFTTAGQPGVLTATGRLREMTGKEYTDRSDRLCRGDILVTKTQGHTVIVLSDGLLADRRGSAAEPAPENPVRPDGTIRALTSGSYWLRARPSLTGARIMAVPDLSWVRVYGRVGSWYGVRHERSGRKGYISAKALPALEVSGR